MSKMAGKSEVAYLEFISTLLNQKLISADEAKRFLAQPLQLNDLLAYLNFKETGLGKELE